MTRQTMNLRAAVVLGLAIPAASALCQQYSGTSHPDPIPVTITDDGVRQPVVYVAPPPSGSTETVVVTESSTTLKTRPEATRHETAQHEATFGASPVRPEEPGLGRGAAINSAANVDADAGIVTHVDGPANRLPEGTVIHTRLLQSLSTQTTVEGAEWKAELLEPVMRDGRVLLPAGATLRGKITEVHGGKRISGQAAIHLLPLSLMMPDGISLAIHGQVIDTSLYHAMRVDNEGTILHREHRKEEAAILGLTVGSGAAAGAVLAGPPGAAVGAGLGAGVSTVLWLKSDRQADLPRDTQITFELTRPLVVGQQ